MKTIVLTISMSIVGMLFLSAQSITTSVTPSCPSPNCNGSIVASVNGTVSPPITWSLVGVSIMTTSTNFVTFTNICPGTYTLYCMDNLGQFAFTSVNVPTYTANPPVIQTVTYAPAPVPPYQPFQYIATVSYTGGTAPYTVTWYNYSTVPPSVITTHTTNNLQDTISLYPGDYGVSVIDQTSVFCGSSPSTYTFSICDNAVGSGTFNVVGAIASNPTITPSTFTVCANTTFTVNYIPIPNAPVNMIMPFTITGYTSCSTGAPTFTCNLPTGYVLTVQGQWLYSNNCPPTGNSVIMIYTDACLSTPQFVNTISTLSFYPNPTDGELNIFSSSSIERVEIYNTVGEKLFEEERPINNSINIQHLPNGIYFIKTFSENNIHTQKIILQKE
ncbi:MAG: hypothetical protein KatS3mg027_1549 [Bacteroidia bacterium]|nr:MAG: hypothetical protein KatS3mg027_1549 [Bacteroidia bacterium]